MKDHARVLHSREYVLHLLAEAAELEHNILCSYLYAAFSLKQRQDEGVTAVELEAIGRWRDQIMGLCVEEMIHLAQVGNLMVALGSRPHLNRPNLPVAPGYHPAGVAIGLAPLDLDTLEHFIYLERPEEIPVSDPPAFQEGSGPDRPQRPALPLMPRAPDYATIGAFYEALRQALERAAREIGHERLFIGPPGLQLTAAEMRSPDLVVVRGLDDARRAIGFIVEQGEGSQGQRRDSHFGRFEAMKAEFLALRASRPGFAPARDAARHPVMHAPVAEDRVWIDGAQAAPVLDAANAAYAAMLRCLGQLYDTPAEKADLRQALLQAALCCMHTVSALGPALTELPARDRAPSPSAGISFAVLRAIEGPLAQGALPMLAERLHEIAARILALGLDAAIVRRTASGLQSAAGALGRAE